MSNSPNFFSVGGQTFLADKIQSVTISRTYSRFYWNVLQICNAVALLTVVRTLVGMYNITQHPAMDDSFLALFPYILVGCSIIVFLVVFFRRNFYLVVVETAGSSVPVFGSSDYAGVQAVKEKLMEGLQTGVYPKLQKPFVPPGWKK